MAGFHLVFCADPAATGIMIYEAASAYKEADLLRTGDDPCYLGAPSGKAEWAMPSRRADQGRDGGAAEI
jgi:hypothetical protein